MQINLLFVGALGESLQQFFAFIAPHGLAYGHATTAAEALELAKARYYNAVIFWDNIADSDRAALQTALLALHEHTRFVSYTGSQEQLIADLQKALAG